jgi:hypothetical protein
MCITADTFAGLSQDSELELPRIIGEDSTNVNALELPTISIVMGAGEHSVAYTYV